MGKKSYHSPWFIVPACVIFGLFFLIPTITSFYFSLRVWNFDSSTFTGLLNFKLFLTDSSLSIGIKNTFLYAVLTCILKVVFGFLIALALTGRLKTKGFLRSVVFFPTLVSTVAVGITFSALMHPTKGLINRFLGLIGLSSVDWLGNIDIALLSVILTDVWKGLGIATIIYIAGMKSIDTSYYEAAEIDGVTGWQRVRYITIPLCLPSINSVIILAFISGMRTFDLIWSMTGGGPGMATDVMASIIYKQYAAGYWGISTAGNVILLIMIAVLAFPLQKFLLRWEEV